MNQALAVDAQIDDRGRGGGVPLVAAAVNRDHRSKHHQIAGISSRRQWRGSKARLNCRGFTASALSFTRRSTVLDEINLARVLDAANWRSEQIAAALEFNPLHHQACKLSDAAETVHIDPLSSAARCHDQHRDTDRGRKIGKAFQQYE